MGQDEGQPQAAVPQQESRALPLAGVTVLDLGQIYNGPYCGFLLAMAGARVIKVEPPGGEHLRRRGSVGGGALPFAMLNSNKQFVTINLKTPAGLDLLKQMVARADVLLENFAPGAMDRLGAGFEVLSQINPRLIYAQGSGYGLSGPNRDKPAMDLTVQAMTGIMSITGFPDRPPVKAGPALCDFLGGVHLYGALVTALFERERTGRGRLVEVAMQEAVYASLSSSLGLWYSTKGAVPARTGNQHGGLAECPYNVYPTQDGHLAIICVGEAHWHSLLQAMGRTDLGADQRYASLKDRVARMAEVDEIVSAFTAGFRRDDLHALLVRHRVPCAPVRDLGEVATDAHMHSRRALEWVDHPVLGRVVLPNSPLRFDGSDLPQIDPAGEIGRDTGAVFGDWLGFSATDIERLHAEGVL
ncbi:CaiB/BaiF CoA-transferase family protein [Roseomonas sp. 18066]|uniref:CaiB/BaiF CoA transferase family protein n=1 Tax=Roseomonas sp. 18066 TaxID=2681412 RepID=UPI00135CBFF6|nr:CoA transferase [Roseomonas sp. 18066]